MKRQILLVFLVASTIAIAHAFPPSSLQNHHPMEKQSAFARVSGPARCANIADSFGSLTHSETDDQNKVARERRGLLKLVFGGNGGYGEDGNYRHRNRFGGFRDFGSSSTSSFGRGGYDVFGRYDPFCHFGCIGK